jgi:NAD(P) transhydrogenase subunit beta
MSSTVVNLIYLIAGVLFILGIKGLTKPSTAVRGNQLSSLGMLLAVVVTLLNSEIVNFTYIIAEERSE